MRCLLRRLPLIFWDSSRGFALALFGLSQGPVGFQPYLGSLAALMAAIMGAAICLAVLLAAMKLAATSGRMVSAACSKFWAGQVKEKLLSGWVLGSYLEKVMLQIPQVGRCRTTDLRATVFSAPAFPCIVNEGITTAVHAMDHFRACIIKCLQVPMSLDDKHSLQPAESSEAAAACKGSPRFQLFLKKDQKTILLVLESGMKLRRAAAAYVNEDQYLATIGGRLLKLDETIAEVGL